MNRLSFLSASMLLVSGLLLSCDAGERATPEAAPGADVPVAEERPADEAAPGANIVVAEIGGRPILQSELDAWLRDDLWRQETEGKDDSDLYELRSDGLERMIEEKLLEEEAARQGKSPDELLESAAVGVGEVTDEAVSDFYEENQERLGGATFEEIGPRIRAYLEGMQQVEAVGEYKVALRERAGVSIRLEPPRLDVAATGPSLGPEDAPVTIIEFSDYQCPFSQRVEPTIKQVLERYGERVRLVFRHFPLGFHDRARAAAEAAACAHAQGRFWEYHERLFSAGGDMADEDLERLAKESGVEADGFKTCVGERRFKDQVDEDIQAGTRAGVDGTPAFFVNGIRLSGAQPLDAFVSLIDRELARLGGEAGSGS